MRIYEERIRTGLTQKELAKKAEMSPSQLSNYERNLITPTNKVLSRIANALNVPVEVLYDNDAH